MHATVSELLDGILTDRPDATALTDERRQWTYRELDEVTRRRAARLAETPTGGRVALVGEHSADAIVWALAVLRSGRIYTPINPNTPTPRIVESLTAAHVTSVICLDGEQEVTLRGRGPWTLVDAEMASETAEAASRVASSAVAYSIFTSGSTGQPKLVDVGHEGIGALCRSQREAFGLRAGDRVVQFASLSFDASIAEILVTLAAGATLVVPAHHGGPWLPSVERHLAEHGCDLITLPPSVYARLGRSARERIGTVVFAGEALHAAEFEEASAHSRVLNAYGPTEATVCFSIYESSQFSTSIGRPIDGFAALVRVDGSLRENGRGELVLLGPGVALGYAVGGDEHGGPFTVLDGMRAYFSGDDVEIVDGVIFYRGRIDDQIKRLGHRISPVDVESRIARTAAGSAVLVANDDELVLVREQSSLSEEVLRNSLSETLAPWEMPDRVVSIPALPLTDNGKIDRAAVVQQVLAGNAPVEQVPTVAQTVSAFVTEVIGRPLDEATSLFRAGGTSMSLVRLQMKLASVYGEDEVREAFAHMNYDFTIRAFVEAIAADVEQEGAASETAVLREAQLHIDRLRADLAGIERPRICGDRRTLLLSGPGGFIGGRILERAIDEFDAITVVSTTSRADLVRRHSDRLGRAAEDFATVRVVDYDELAAIAEGTAEADTCDVVVHAGYNVNHALPLREHLLDSVARTADVVRAAARLGAERFVFLSAASVGERFEPLSAAVLSAIDDPYSQSKAISESVVDVLATIGCAVDILRCGLVYGHDATEREFLELDTFAQMFRLSLENGMFPVLRGEIPMVDVSTVVEEALFPPTRTGRRHLVIERSYSAAQIIAELGLTESGHVDPELWLRQAAQSEADPRVLSAISKSLDGYGWPFAVAGDRPVLRGLRGLFELEGAVDGER
ncbi:AMP-binding protein [Rathayibacter tritici]|nr:AMP-binding protein [Rathayibacter tritici]